MDPSSIIGVSSRKFINLTITNNVTSVNCEKRYPDDLTVGEFKAKLELVTGCNHKAMTLKAFDAENHALYALDDDTKRLADYPGLTNGCRIHAHDPTTSAGHYDALRGVDEMDAATLEASAEQYRISYEEYLKRDDTVLAWKRKNKIGQFKEVDPEEEAQKKAAAEHKLAEEEAQASGFQLGDRCEVRLDEEQMAKRGEIAYKGPTHFRDGFWIGVKYDEPVGKNNGTVGGRKYFECADKYGVFVKPKFVQVGDYPELDLDDLDEI